LPKYKHLQVKRIALSDLAPAQKGPKALTPRQQATLERDEEIRQAFNEAAALPASEGVTIDLKDGQKMSTLRAAINRILKLEPRELNFGVRGQTVIISRGAIPGGRGRKARA
jgi:hypothetical protein